MKKPPKNRNVSPILFIEWLRPGDRREADEVFRSSYDAVEIRFAEVSTKDEVVSAIKRWLHRNRNAQYLYFSTHGDQTSIGIADHNCIRWSELRDLLKGTVNPKRPISVWFGACRSSHAASEWSPFAKDLPVSYAVGFPVDVGENEVAEILKRLVRMTRVDRVIYVDQEISKLRKAIPGMIVEMHYKAMTKSAEVRYVNFNTFKSEVGITLKKYLELKGKLGKGNLLGEALN